ncbi:endonuclease/exonuclease/phosphatase family protein [Yoonia sp. MH D7]
MASAETLRIATFAAPLSRDGPGVLLRDIRKGEDAQINAIAEVVATVAPDVIVLTDFDYDLDGLALSAAKDLFARKGVLFAHRFSALPNTGMQTGLDMEGDGRTGDARDGQGYGRFSGDGGLDVLSRFPIDIANVTDFSALLWRDLRDAELPEKDGKSFPSLEVEEIQRLSTSSHWIVPILPTSGVPFDIFAWSATPPVFDGPEDKNGLRNRDELRLWETVIEDGRDLPFFVVGNANLDPFDGDGLIGAMLNFLRRAEIQDPAPQSLGALFAADPTHKGPAQMDTADWPQDGPGNLRVSYVLPSVDWKVTDSGVFWPAPDDPQAALLGGDGMAAGAHHLVWVDVAR